MPRVAHHIMDKVRDIPTIRLLLEVSKRPVQFMMEERLTSLIVPRKLVRRTPSDVNIEVIPNQLFLGTLCQSKACIRQGSTTNAGVLGKCKPKKIKGGDAKFSCVYL